MNAGRKELRHRVRLDTPVQEGQILPALRGQHPARQRWRDRIRRAAQPAQQRLALGQQPGPFGADDGEPLVDLPQPLGERTDEQQPAGGTGGRGGQGC